MAERDLRKGSSLPILHDNRPCTRLQDVKPCIPGWNVYIIPKFPNEIHEIAQRSVMKQHSIASLVMWTGVVLSIAGCDSSTGNTKVDLVPPPIPAGFTISQIGNGAVTLTWQPVSDSELKGYNVYWQGGSAIDTLKANRMFVATSNVVITDLDYETTYAFSVSSIDLSGNESRLSVLRSGTPYNTTPPLPPINIDLVAENIEYPKITLYWSENSEPDIAHYNIYRSLSSNGMDGNLDPIAVVTQQTHCADTEIEVGQTYYYWLTAMDKGGKESAPSAIVGDAVLPKPTLETPVNFEYVGATPTFRWQITPGAKKYNVVVTTSRIGGEIWNAEVDGAVSQTTYTGKTKLISGNTYYWKVGAISRREINSVSAVGSFVVRAQ